MEPPENFDDMINTKKVYVAFLVIFFFEVTILNIYLLRLLQEKVDKIKSIIFSCRVLPVVYYLSRILGDLIFTGVLYAIIYGALRIGANTLIAQHSMEAEFNNLWGLLLIWKTRYILISYLLSHFITGSVQQVLKYYMYIYALINGGFVVLAVYYPRLPFDYVFDSGSIWLYTFKSQHVVDWRREVGGVLVNFALALGVSSLLDSFRLNRNFWNQKKARKEMRAREQATQSAPSLNHSFSSDKNISFQSLGQDAPLMPGKSLSQRSFSLNQDLKVRQLSKTYGTCFKKQVIENISFDLRAQSAFGLVGPNGSGKTTTFRILASELSRSKGHLFLDGSLNFRLLGVRDSLFWRQNIGVCFQNDFLYDDMSVEQHISFYCKLNGMKYRGIGKYFDEHAGASPETAGSEDSDSFEMEKMLEKDPREQPKESDLPDAPLGNFLDMVPRTHNPFLSGIESALDILRFRSVKAKDLSSGNKRKLCILVSLLKNLDLAIWDEATCGLDVLARYSIRQLLFSLKTQNEAKLLITTHFLNDVDLYCDQIGILKRGVFGFIGSTEALKDEFGGYCVVLRGNNKCMKRVLSQLEDVASWRILEQKEMEDSETPEEEEYPQESTPFGEEEGDSGLRHRSRKTSQPRSGLVTKRPSLHVNFSRRNRQSVIKLHVEKFRSISCLFEFLCTKIESKELYDFFLNQYNVEHIYVELMNDAEA